MIETKHRQMDALRVGKPRAQQEKMLDGRDDVGCRPKHLKVSDRAWLGMILADGIASMIDRQYWLSSSWPMITGRSPVDRTTER